jgi:hypothetical protein
MFGRPIDSVKALFPGPRIPDAPDHRIAAKVAAGIQVHENLTLELANQDATAQASKATDVAKRRENIAGFVAPRFQTRVYELNYGEHLQERVRINVGWVLTGITLLPGWTLAGAVNNPGLFILTGIPDLGGAMFGVPFDVKPVDCILEQEMSGWLSLDMSVSAVSPGALLVYPRAILRFQNWSNGSPLEGGNQ